MIKDLCTVVCRNKNLLMLVTAGIYILALYSALSGHTLLFSVLITFAFAAFLIKDYFKPKYILIWILIFYFGIYNTTSRLKDTDELLNLAPVNSVISGQILSIPQDKGKDKISFFFKVNKIEYDGNVREFDNEKVLVTLNTNEKLKIYDYYKIKGRLSVPFKAGNPSQFDYGNYLRNFNVYAVFYGAKGAEPVFLNSDLSAREKVLQWINDYREKIISIHSNYLSSPNLEILGGIVFGDDAVSPPENIKQSFINSGLLHILAASGMNVAFIFSFFFFFLSALKVNYKVNISAGIVMVIVYSLMTGLGASVVRATFMLVFVLIGKLIDRDAHSISLLAFVAFLMLLYNPMYINDVGFQLSFIVTFGLLIMTPFLMRGKNKFVNWVIGTVSIPIIAQLWVMPIQIFYFNNISLYSVFANIMSVPILSVISFGGFVSSLIATITPSFVCRCFDFVLNPMLTLLVNISDFWGKLPNAAIQTTHPSVFQIILYYAVLLLITALMDKNIRENYLDDSDLIYIKPEFAAKYESKELKENDIIVMRTGYPGVACLVPKKYEGCQTFTTLIVRLRSDNNPSYVCNYINSDFGKRFVDLEKVGVAQQNVGARSLAHMPIKIAPRELQDKFATFVKQIDKSKAAVQKALDETKMLFDSLMQEYFG